MERLYADRQAEHVERLAYHAMRGEVWESAVLYLRQAGLKAAAQAANREAVSYFEEALAALGRLAETRENIERAIDIRLELRPPLLQRGEIQRVLDLSREVERLAQQIEDESRLARVYTYLINYHYLRGEADAAIEYGERCLGIGESTGDLALRTFARGYMGQSRHAQGRCREAEEILAANVQEFAAVATPGDMQRAGLSYVTSGAWLAFTRADQGDFDRALEAALEAQRAAELTRHPYTQVIASTLTGLVWLRRGHLERALALLEQSLEACRERQLKLWRPIPSALLGHTFVLLGRVKEALPLLEDCVALSRELGVKAYLPLWLGYLADAELAAGQGERAQTLAREALDLAMAHGEEGHQAWIHGLLGRIAASGPAAEAEAAEVEYLLALPLAEERGLRPLTAQLHLALGALHRRAGDRAKAHAHLTRAMTRFQAMDMRFWLDQASDEIRELGRLFVVGREHADLFAYLQQKFGRDDGVRVVLDGRQGDRRGQRAGGEVRVERRKQARRRLAVEEELRDHGLVVLAPAETAGI
jgi:tetratricopeptide (TPR) repeat protein